jgi:lipopolysaccharide biosynthesis regulator YciM
MTQRTSIKRWMKMPMVSARGRLVHFILSCNEDGLYITTCGKANGKDFEDLTEADEELVKNNPDFRCSFCSYSPRYYHAIKELENSNLEA